MGRAQESLLRTQQQIATGKRVMTPSDDPVASTQAAGVMQAKATLAQYQSNIGTAKDAIGLDESVLSQVTDTLQRVRDLVVQAGSAGLADADRASLARDASSRLDQLIGLANSKDGNGNFMFSGFAVSTQPFVTGSGGIVYNGDQGVRELEVAPARSLALAENGSALFQQIRDGNGTFVSAAAAANTGTGIIAPGQAVAPAALTGHAYQLTFNVAAGVTTYDVFDATTSTSVSTGNAFTSGAAITVAGMQTTISGAPSAGDAFTLSPSTAKSMFATIQDLVTALNTPSAGPVGATRLSNSLSAALTGIDQGLEHVLTVRADVGARLRELDSLTSGNDDRALQYDQTLSRLIDLDYNQALSDFAKQQISLQAAQKSFVQMSGLSLFNYL